MLQVLDKGESNEWNTYRRFNTSTFRRF
jgi:hypothetical protein